MVIWSFPEYKTHGRNWEFQLVIALYAYNIATFWDIVHFPLTSTTIVPFVIHLEVSMLVNKSESTDLVCEFEDAYFSYRLFVVFHFDYWYWIMIILWRFCLK